MALDFFGKIYELLLEAIVNAYDTSGTLTESHYWSRSYAFAEVLEVMSGISRDFYIEEARKSAKTGKSGGYDLD
jgi:hypothetical protein